MSQTTRLRRAVPHDTGVVETWNSEEGWGTVALDHIDVTVWVHYAAIVARPTSYRSLAPGQRVRCHYEVPGQDGYPARAVEVTPLRQEAGD